VARHAVNKSQSCQKPMPSGHVLLYLERSKGLAIEAIAPAEMAGPTKSGWREKKYQGPH
jgi:hypothetical protein